MTNTINKDYWTCYSNRMLDVSNKLMEVAKTFKNLGYTVLLPDDILIKFLKIKSADKHIYVGFQEVPYRFYLSYDIDYRLKHGSGKTLETSYDLENVFTTEKIIKSMQPNVKTICDDRHLTEFKG